MIHVDTLIKELFKFPNGAKVAILGDAIKIRPDHSWVGCGVIDAPLEGRRSPTKLGIMKGWQDAAYPGDGGKIRQWLRANPHKAVEIAFMAISGLYLDHRDEDALPEHESYPRGSGSDYVDHVGGAIEAAGLIPLIQELQAAAEEKEVEA
jgi:hypothetical protein